MRLIVLYGPPAVGKYTIGKLLAERLGFKFLHNHLVVDLVQSVLSVWHPAFVPLAWDIALKVLAEAAPSGIPGIVSTLVYEKNVDDPWIRQAVAIVEKHGGTAVFFQLTCTEDVLMARIADPARARTEKLKSPDVLRAVLRARDIVSPVSFVPTLAVDTTHLSPDDAVEKIIAILKLE